MFTGRRVDILDNGSLKLQYNRNRYYDQYTGRWFTCDPLGYIDGANHYEYVASNPIMNFDPSGGSIATKIFGCGYVSGKIMVMNVTIASKKAHAWGACWGVSVGKILKGLKKSEGTFRKELKCPDKQKCVCEAERVIGPVTKNVDYRMFAYGGGARGDLETWISFPKVPFIWHLWLPKPPPKNKVKGSCELTGKIKMQITLSGGIGKCCPAK